MNNDTPWTPGPWGVNASHIYAPDGKIIATVRNPGSKESHYPLIANRNLMAAAPELAEALADCVSRFHTCMLVGGTSVEYADAATGKYRTLLARIRGDAA